MSDAIRSDEIPDYFGKDKVFTSSDLKSFYEEAGDKSLNQNTLLSRIYNLKKKGVISSVERGRFVVGGRPDLQAFHDDSLNEIRELAAGQFPHIKIVVWSTNALTKLTGRDSHSHLMTLIETDRDACEALFDELRQFRTDLFLNPDALIIDRYVSMHKQPLVIKPLISEAPLEKIKAGPIPSLEKLIVDLLSDPKYFEPWQGQVLRDLIKKIFTRNIINRSALRRYASRRGRLADLEHILKLQNIDLSDSH